MRRYLLIGAAGKTGESYARLLQSHGNHVLWYDKNPDARPQGLNSELTEHVPADGLNFATLSKRIDCVTLTPGVPLKHPFIAEARASGIEIVTEVAYCAPYLDGMRIVGVTGTDGKSTTTTLIAQVLRFLGRPAIECGNFGLPLSEIALHLKGFSDKILVCELSSYQLEEPGKFELEAAIFLNLAPDHLNRYESLEAYGLAKWNIARLLKPSAPLIIGTDLLPQNSKLWKNAHPLTRFQNPVISVDTRELSSTHFQVVAGMLCNEKGQWITSLAQAALFGQHNHANLLFALEAVEALGVENLRSSIPDILPRLAPLPHRFEPIVQKKFPQMSFINDSKATTTQAAITALENSVDPVFIFLGGQGKGESYTQLAAQLKRKNAQALIYGECREDMARDFLGAGYEQFTLHENLFKAFHTAKRMVLQRNLPHATLLLAPAATSWDQFKSFEERGDYFRGLVAGLN